MKRFPPKKFVKGKIQNLRRFVARIEGFCWEGLNLKYWVNLGHGQFSNDFWKCLFYKDITSSSIRSYRDQDAIAIWQWSENGVNKTHVARWK